MTFVSTSFEIKARLVKYLFKPNRTVYSVVRRDVHKYWRCDSYTNIKTDVIVYETELLDDAIKMRLKYRTEGIV